jgi:putative colanic acid biosynthesis UDP-glucose lipid carrier transferase
MYVNNDSSAQDTDIGLFPETAIIRRPAAPLSKRVLDVLCILLILPLALPVLAIAALAIKATSRGPILFTQHRYGLGRVPFRVYKLRSMSVAEDGDAFRQARKGDTRITPVGAFLRKTSIDELPQLLNVLRGDMSLVGPRPHPTKLDNDFAQAIPGYNRRFAVMPGITGLAQVRGHRGETDTLEKMRVRVESDIEYVDTRSLWMDILIMMRTTLVVASQRNAG